MPRYHRPLTLILVVLASVMSMLAQDTITVKTLTFQDTTKRSGTWLFPPPQSYERVLMEYTLKCDQATTQDGYPCGEWDYLTYTVITDSTGEYDSTGRKQVNYMVGGSTPQTFSYSTNFVNQRYRFKETAVNRGGSEGTWYQVGSGVQANPAIITSEGARSRYIWTDTELKNAGMDSGSIVGIQLNAIDSADEVSLLTIRMKNIGAATAVPDLVDETDYVTVVRRSVPMNKGANKIPFSSSFPWDGKSNVAVEILCYSATADVSLSSSPSNSQGREVDGSRYAFQFRQGDRIQVPKRIRDHLSGSITIDFWSLGDKNALPVNHNLMEAYDAKGRRVINIHLPWSNNNVYWDAGIDPVSGANDRISKPINEFDAEGKWVHWAFVKDGYNGMMYIYRNGELLHSGSSQNRSMAGITEFVVGAGQSGSYRGMLDEFRVWNKALDQTSIQTWMSRQVTNLHPDFDNLILYYHGEKDTRENETYDESLLALHGQLFGMPVKVDLFADHLGTTSRVSTGRPLVSFEQGTVNTQTSRVDRVIEQVPRRTSVVLYRDNIQPRIYHPKASDHPTKPLDTLIVQEAGWLPVIDEDGLKVDSFNVAAEQTLNRVEMPWFDPVVEFEIGRFITPYGIGLDLGPNGFKWVYDVTEYAPLLRNNVTLRAGNQQEFIDLTFKFIKGTPPRDVVQIKQLWSDRNAEFTNVTADTKLAPVDVALSADASAFTVKSIASGHRFDNPTNCAEFCQRNHYIDVDGTRAHTWLLWTECGDNPVFPQGGTWLIDRAGWCPGAPVDEYVRDITALVTPGSTTSIDYGIETAAVDDSYGVWDVTGQLFGYGPANRELDLAITDVIRPSNWEFYGRLNPICGNPQIIIQNVGATTVTSATLQCWTVGGAPLSYEWSGSLEFMEFDTVDLPIPDWQAEVYQTDGRKWVEFVTRITEVNGRDDDYEGNNATSRKVNLAEIYYSDLQILLKTNNQAAAQYEWTLRKIDGEVIQTASNLADNTLYTYDFELENGCYDFELINKEGYGLDFWFLRSQLGTGSLQFKSGGKVIKTFEPDFGNRAWMQFTVAPKPTVLTSTDTLYFQAPTPQPIEKTVVIRSGSEAPLHVEEVSIFALSGHYTIKSTSIPLPATLNVGDSIVVTVVYDRPDAGKSNGTLRINTNDERELVRVVRLVGEIGTTGVDDLDLSADVEAAVVPNPVTSWGEVVLTNLARTGAATVDVHIVNLLGTDVATLFTGDVIADQRIPLPIGLPSGTYRVVVRSGIRSLSVPFLVTH